MRVRLVLARVDRLVFGAFDDKAGAVGGIWDVVRDPRLNHRVEVVSGVRARGVLESAVRLLPGAPMNINRVAVSTAFFCQGFAFASLITRIPAIQDRFGFSEGGLAMLLAAVPIVAGCRAASWPACWPCGSTARWCCGSAR